MELLQVLQRLTSACCDAVFLCAAPGWNCGKIPLKTNGWNQKSSLNYYIYIYIRSFQESFEPKTLPFFKVPCSFSGGSEEDAMALIDQFDQCVASIWFVLACENDTRGWIWGAVAADDAGGSDWTCHSSHVVQRDL